MKPLCVMIQMKAIEQYFQVTLCCLFLTIVQNEIQDFSSVLNLALLGVKRFSPGFNEKFDHLLPTSFSIEFEPRRSESRAREKTGALRRFDSQQKKDERKPLSPGYLFNSRNENHLALLRSFRTNQLIFQKLVMSFPEVTFLPKFISG